MKKSKKVLLSIGANIGEIEQNFRIAVRKLRKNGLESVRISSLYQTKALGCAPDTPDFINAAISGFWGKSVQALYQICKKIEIEAGRPENHPKWSSRTLDIDIAFFGNHIISTPRITIPHKEALNRLFVILPIAEIEKEFQIPSLKISIGDYLSFKFNREEIEKLKSSAKSL